MTVRERIREFLHGFTPYRRLGLIIGIFALACLLIWGFYEASWAIKERWARNADAKLVQHVKDADARASAADERSKELQLKLIDKGNQLAAAEKRAEEAENALMNARRDTARVRAQYEKARTAHTTDTRTVDDLCSKLAALGEPCQ